MNYFLFSGIPGIINISWIIVQYCPITVKPFPFIFIHPALSFLIAFEGGFFISFNPNNASFLYLFSTSLSYTPPIFFFPILYSPYSLLSSNPHTLHLPLLPLFSTPLFSTPPIFYSPFPLLPLSSTPHIHHSPFPLFFLSLTPPILSYRTPSNLPLTYTTPAPPNPLNFRMK